MARGGAEVVIRNHRSDPPCRGCDKRSSDCHAHCIDYADWKEQNEEFKSHMRDCINADTDVRAFLYNKSKRSPSYHSAKHRKKGETNGT